MEKLDATAHGAVAACEAVAFPLTLIPGIGSIAASIIDWACLVPAAMAVDYVGVHHAGYESWLWQPLLGLLLAKLWRTAVLTVGITVIVASSLLYTGVVSTALVLAGLPYYIPVGLTGVITVIGVLILGMRAIERGGSDFVFMATYTNLANTLRTPEEAAAAQRRSWLKPPPGPFGRAFALLSAAAGAEPPGSWTHAIPVAGPLYEAGAKAEAVEEATLQVGRDVLGERPQFPNELRATAQVASWTEGVFGAAGQTLLGVGGLLFATGTVLAALDYSQREELGEFALYSAGLGSVGVVIAGGGVAFILLRQVPKVARALLVPLAFGILPPPSEEEVE